MRVGVPFKLPIGGTDPNERFVPFSFKCCECKKSCRGVVPQEVFMVIAGSRGLFCDTCKPENWLSAMEVIAEEYLPAGVYVIHKKL